jgi:hypothetical protein
MAGERGRNDCSLWAIAYELCWERAAADLSVAQCPKPTRVMRPPAASLSPSNCVCLGDSLGGDGGIQPRSDSPEMGR